MQETRVQSLGWKDSLGKEMATHTSILAWEIPRTEASGRLQSMGSQSVRHDWTTTIFISNSCMTSLFYLAHCPPGSSMVSNVIFFRLNSILLYTQTYHIFLIHLAVSGPLKWKWNSLSRVWLFATPSTPISPWNSPGQNTGVGQNTSHSLLQGIFPTQGLNPGLPRRRRILYLLSH